MDILIIDDEESIRQSTAMAVEAEGHYAETADDGKSALMRVSEEAFDLIFLDLRLGEENGLDLLPEILKKRPEALVVMFTAYATVETAVEATRLGAFDYLNKPFGTDDVRGILLKARKAQAAQQTIEKLETTVTELKSEAQKFSPPTRFDSEDPMMQAALETIFRAAQTPASILILGESGTGKSVIAKTIHANSHLKDKPFVTISCPSLSKELLESELFGHVKGAFTGAIKDAWGKVHAANGGTLFLDEIGELPMEIQPKLLRVLQEKEYERLGENKTRKADVRIIAATNRDLQQSVKDGDFREDLFYRINVINVVLPPLRARSSDLLRFAHDYLEYFASQVGRELSGFSKDALATLKNYRWPGNLRELRNAIERATIMAAGNEIEPGDLPSEASLSGKVEGGGTLYAGGDFSLEELEAEHIKLTVERFENLHEAADLLGIDKATLYRKRKKLKID